MKKILIFLIMLSAKSFAQSQADSIYFFNQSINNIKVIQRNATFLLSDSIDRFGMSEIFYDNKSGGYRVSQQAQKTIYAGLYSEGIHKIGRFKSSGYFSFTRTWQDSLAWSTKGLEQDDQPYYYGSVKAGAFERFNYKLGGIMSYNLLKDKLYLASGIDFQYNSATRSVDPRPKVNTFSLVLNPEIIYRLNKHFIGFNVKWGYGTEITNISFKNTDFKNSTTGYPDRVNYLFQGYGLYSNSQNVDAPLKRINKYYGVGLNYSGIFNSYAIKSSASYNATLEDSYQDLDNSINRAYLGLYDTDLLSFFLQINKQYSNSSNQLSISYQNQNSRDINTRFYAINYRFLQDQGSLNYFVRFNKNNKISPEFGVISDYKKVDKKDLSSDHHVNFSWIEPTIFSTIYYKIDKGNNLSGGVGLGYRKPLKSNISIPPSQETIFTTGVVYPDFSYNTSSSFKIAGKIQYLTKNIFNDFTTGFSAKATYYQMDKEVNIFPNANRTLGRSLFDINFSLNLYF